MQLSQVQDVFGSRLHCARGFHFTGQLMAITTEEASSTFISPRRLLKVGPKCLVKAGDVVRLPTGKSYLVGDHGPSELFNSLLFYTYRLFEVTHVAAHKGSRPTGPKNPITGQVTVAASVDDEIPVAIEFIKSQQDEMKISGDMIRIISASPLLVNDVVDQYIITNVEPQLGLFFATARRK